MQIWKRVALQCKPYKISRLNGKPRVLNPYKTGSYILNPDLADRNPFLQREKERERVVVVSGREGERVTKRVGLLLLELHFSWERACGRQREIFGEEGWR